MESYQGQLPSDSEGGSERIKRAAKALGTSTDTLSKIHQVVIAAREDPETFGDLVENQKGKAFTRKFKRLKIELTAPFQGDIKKSSRRTDPGARLTISREKIGAHRANQGARTAAIGSDTPPQGGYLVTMTKAKKITSTGKICKATRTDGEPCQAPAQAEKDYCFFHDPDREGDRLEASKRGGLNRGRRKICLPTAATLDPEETRGILSGVIEAVVTGALDAGTARTVGYLLQIEARIREGHDLEKQMEAIEEKMKEDLFDFVRKKGRMILKEEAKKSGVKSRTKVKPKQAKKKLKKGTEH